MQALARLSQVDRKRFFMSTAIFPRRLYSFPTRRSSDLRPRSGSRSPGEDGSTSCPWRTDRRRPSTPRTRRRSDRKSTRLNSSHGYISYAVFGLKEKSFNSETSTVIDLDGSAEPVVGIVR